MTSSQAASRVIVVGGGFSGLATAVGLTSRGIPTLLLEQKPSLGGRAYSFTDTATGDAIDNGQHVLIAGYHRTLKFLETIGSRDLVAVQDRPALLFHHPDRGFQSFRLPKLPPPLHLVAGVLSTGLLPLADRLRILRAGASIGRVRGRDAGGLSELTVQQWLDAHGQSAEARRSFWEPLAIAIMNEHISRASAAMFVRALRMAFLSRWKTAAMVIPRVGLSELYVEQARRFITAHGGEVRCETDVVQLAVNGHAVSGVRLRGGTTEQCHALVLAVPPNKVVALLPEELQKLPQYAALRAMTPSPIVSVHLWFEEDCMEHEFVGVIGRTVQWVFNRRRVTDKAVRGGHVSAVISAAYDVVSLTNEEITQRAVNDLRATYPRFAPEPVRALVVREKRATFSSTPQTEPLRPNQETPFPNLFLAGDWTATGYPATIEGAVVSGDRCAELASRCFSGQKGPY